MSSTRPGRSWAQQLSLSLGQHSVGPCLGAVSSSSWSLRLRNKVRERLYVATLKFVEKATISSERGPNNWQKKQLLCALSLSLSPSLFKLMCTSIFSESLSAAVRAGGSKSHVSAFLPRSHSAALHLSHTWVCVTSPGTRASRGCTSESLKRLNRSSCSSPNKLP